MRSRTRWLALLATMSWGLSASAAPDAERLKTAAEEFDAGRRAFKTSQYETSAIHFENADRDAPSPEALQSAIKARKEANQIARALTLAAWGVARYPNDKAFGDFAKGLLSDGEKGLFKVNISCTPDCSLIVDNKVMPFGDTGAAIVYVEPGAHTVVAGWSSNRHKSSDVTAVVAGSSRLVFAAPPIEKAPDPLAAPEPAVTPPPAPDSDLGPAKEKKSGLPPAVFFVGVGATVILGGVTAWSGVDTLNNPGKDAVATNCKGLGEACPDYQTGLSHQRRTNILIGVTGVVGVTTAVLGLFLTKWGGDGSKSDKKDAFVSPVLGLQDGVSVGAVGRF